MKILVMKIYPVVGLIGLHLSYTICFGQSTVRFFGNEEPWTDKINSKSLITKN